MSFQLPEEETGRRRRGEEERRRKRERERDGSSYFIRDGILYAVDYGGTQRVE